MITPLFIIPILTLFVISFINLVYRSESILGNSKVSDSHVLVTIKLVTLLSLVTSLGYGAYLWKAYPKLLIHEDGEPLIIYPGNTWIELNHSLNLPFLILSTFIILISLLAAWYSSVNIFLFSVLMILLEICLVGAFGCINVFVFLLFFEASALPIFALVVYCGNPRRERLKASYYFLFFTLYGSISLLLLILNVYTLKQLDFSDNLLNNRLSSYTSWLLLFIAFAVKIPLFPFHLWLPHAHVEASTATSIILAALMLKLGGYGMVKFMLPLFSVETHLFFRPFAVLICVTGAIYGGIVALRQIDLKRQVAFSSVAHMSFATLGIFTFTEVGIKGSIYLMLSHGLTSAMMFYLVGILSDRYHTRSVMAYSGLMSTMPMFSFFIIIASLANVGFPLTSGFLPEVLVVIAIMSSLPVIIVPVLLGMLLTTASTLTVLLRILFGHTKTSYFNSGLSDITKLEFFICMILSAWILILGVSDILAVDFGHIYTVTMRTIEL